MKSPLHRFFARVRDVRQLIQSVKTTANELIASYRDYEAAERHAIAEGEKSRSQHKRMEFIFWRAVAAEIASQGKRAASDQARSRKPEENGK